VVLRGYQEELLPDTKLTEDVRQQIIGGYFSSNFAQVKQWFTNIK
jgi:hypothetical protein